LDRLAISEASPAHFLAAGNSLFVNLGEPITLAVLYGAKHLNLKSFRHQEGDLFDDAPAVLTSQPGATGPSPDINEIELGIRDTMLLHGD
jgi:hypothetical protein